MNPTPADRLIEHPLFARMPAHDRIDLCRGSAVRIYRPREVVFRAGDDADGVRVLLSGSVRVFHASPDGVESAVKLFKAPGIFGEISVVAGVPFGEDVAALEVSEIVTLPKGAFLRLVDRDASLARALLRHVSACFCVASHTEAALSFDDVRSRLAHLLVGYVRLYPVPVPGLAGALAIRLPLTQDDMANALGVTRRAVANEIARWQKNGVIDRRAGRYVVTRLDVLGEEGTPARYSIGYEMGAAPVPAGVASANAGSHAGRSVERPADRHGNGANLAFRRDVTPA